MHSLLRRLTAEAGLADQVRLSCSSRLPVPIALGLRRREICVPPRALASLSLEQQEGMLAHELAHLVRRDPFWLAFSHFLTSVLFFQPLNQVARRRLRERSELRSDEWAVGQTGRPRPGMCARSRGIGRPGVLEPWRKPGDGNSEDMPPPN